VTDNRTDLIRRLKAAYAAAVADRAQAALSSRDVGALVDGCRRDGMSFEEIAVELGVGEGERVTRQRVWKIHRDHLAALARERSSE
jgi:hypothetical protein